MNQAPQNQPIAAKYRQYILAAVFALLVLYFGGEWFWNRVLEGPIDSERQKTRQLVEKLKKKIDEWENAKKNAAKLARWRGQSLPSDTEVARSLYQAWLLELVDYVKLVNPSVNSGEPISRQGRFQAITFSVRGRGTLGQLTELLFVFYQTDLLHQIRSLNITPLSNTDLLDLTMSIETLVLPGAGPELDEQASEEQRQETVFEDFRRRASRPSRRLASVTPGKLVSRKLRQLSGAAPDAKPDPALIALLKTLKYTLLKEVDASDGALQASFVLGVGEKKPPPGKTKETSPPRRKQETLKLHTGESLQLDPFRATIAEIEGSEVLIEWDGRRWRINQGERLSDAYLPPTLDDYQSIVTRNLFGIGGDPDPTDYAYLTSITSINGEPQVWLTLRASDEILKLGKGDRFEIGNFAGTIAEIEGSDVIIESEGERWLLTLGECLADAWALPPEF